MHCDDEATKKLIGAAYWELLSLEVVAMILERLRGQELGALGVAHRAFGSVTQAAALSSLSRKRRQPLRRVSEPAWRLLRTIELFPPTCPASASSSHALMATEVGTVYAIGRGTCGQLGLGESTFQVTEPTCIAGLSRALQVSVGAHQSLVLDDLGRLWVFGKARHDEPALFEPRQLHVGASTPTWISAGPHHCLVVDEDGTAWAWGKNSHGQLGLGSIGRAQPSPRAIAALRGKCIVQASAGAFHTLLLDAHGAVYACGLGADGRLGLGQSINSPLPERVALDAKVASLSAGVSHSACVSTDGHLYAWGDPSRGALSHRDLDASRSPKRVDQISHKRVVACACSMRKTYALDDDGIVWTIANFTLKKLNFAHVRALAVSDDDDTLIVASENPVPRFSMLATGHEKQHFPLILPLLTRDSG